MALRDHHEVTVVVGIQVEDDETGAAVEHDQRGLLVLLRLAEHAAARSCVACHVRESPGRPEPIHSGGVNFGARRQTPAISGSTTIDAGAGATAAASASRLINSLSSL